MHGKHYLYEYAVIRFVPKVEREEFINIGMILFSKEANYIRALYRLDGEKIQLFASEVEPESLRESMEVFDKVCAGSSEGGPIALYDVSERFRWLTAVRSTSIQTSRPQSGFSMNLDATLERLFAELVL